MEWGISPWPKFRIERFWYIAVTQLYTYFCISFFNFSSITHCDTSAWFLNNIIMSLQLWMWIFPNFYDAKLSSTYSAKFHSRWLIDPAKLVIRWAGKTAPASLLLESGPVCHLSWQFHTGLVSYALSWTVVPLFHHLLGCVTIRSGSNRDVKRGPHGATAFQARVFH